MIYYRGLILYGNTEVARPELRIIVSDQPFKLSSISVFSVSFDSIGDVFIQDLKDDSLPCLNDSHNNSFHQIQYPPLFNTVRTPNPLILNLPFYGSLIPELNHDFNKAKFKLSSFLSTLILLSVIDT